MSLSHDPDAAEQVGLEPMANVGRCVAKQIDLVQDFLTWCIGDCLGRDELLLDNNICEHVNNVLALIFVEGVLHGGAFIGEGGGNALLLVMPSIQCL